VDRRGDDEFVRFYTAHRNRLAGAISRLIATRYGPGSTHNSIAQADDICQHAWCEVYQRWDGLDRGRGHALFSYVYKAARTRLDEIGRRRAHAREDPSSGVMPEPGAPDGHDPAGALQIRRVPPQAPDPPLSGPLVAALRRLPPAQREVVEVWLDLGHHSWSEVAMVLDKNESTVRNLWAKARPKLQQALDEAERTDTATDPDRGLVGEVDFPPFALPAYAATVRAKGERRRT
jgi:RNA polymerase sigma factor (sigma-70 family)